MANIIFDAGLENSWEGASQFVDNLLSTYTEGKHLPSCTEGQNKQLTVYEIYKQTIQPEIYLYHDPFSRRCAVFREIPSPEKETRYKAVAVENSVDRYESIDLFREPKISVSLSLTTKKHY